MNIDDANEFSDGELERQIRTALVMEVDAARLQRLEEYWRAQSRKDRWQRRVYFTLSAAAAAVVLVGLLIVAKRESEDAKTANVEVAPVQPRADIRPVEKKLVEVAENEPAAQFAGRAPTEYERFMFIARTGKPMPAAGPSKIHEAISRHGTDAQDALAQVEQKEGTQGLLRAARRATDPKLRQAAMAKLLEIGSDESLLAFLSLVCDESTQPAALAVADSTPQLPLDALLGLLDHDNKAVRRSAAFLLGRVNGPAVTQALIARVTESPAGATEAWMALLACRGEKADAFMAYAARRPQLLGHLNYARVQLAYEIP
jgi:HEAT repeat protein